MKLNYTTNKSLLHSQPHRRLNDNGEQYIFASPSESGVDFELGFVDKNGKRDHTFDCHMVFIDDHIMQGSLVSYYKDTLARIKSAAIYVLAAIVLFGVPFSILFLLLHVKFLSSFTIGAAVLTACAIASLLVYRDARKRFVSLIDAYMQRTFNAERVKKIVKSMKKK